MKQGLTDRIFNGGTLIFCAMVFQKLSTAVFLVVLGRQMPVSSFGLLMLGVTSTSLISLFSLFGLPAAAPKFLAGRQPHEMGSATASILTLGAFYALAMVALLIPFRHSLAGIFSDSSGFQTVFLIALLGIPVQAAFRLFETFLQAKERNIQLFLTACIDGTAKIVWPVALYTIFQSVSAAMLGVILAYLTSAITGAFFACGKGGIRLAKPAFSQMKQIARFALPTMLIGFSYVLASQADRLMVGAFRPSAEVGFYAAAAVFAMGLSMLHTAIATIFLPIASDMYHNRTPEELDSLYTVSSRWAAVVSGIGVILFAAFGMPLLGIFGPEFQTPAAMAVLIMLSLFYFTASIFGPTSSVLQMGGSHKREGLNALFFLITNISLNFILIPRIGIPGAALATLISGLLRNVLQAWQLRVNHNIKAIKIDQMVILLVVAVTLSLQFYATPAISAVIATGSSAILVAYLLKGLSEEEKTIASNIGLRLQATFQNR